MKTIRQQLIEILSEGEFTAIDLSQDVGIGEKEVYEHLPHIALSVASQGKKLVIASSRCLKCGYVLKGGRVLPGRVAARNAGKRIFKGLDIGSDNWNMTI